MKKILVLCSFILLAILAVIICGQYFNKSMSDVVIEAYNRYPDDVSLGTLYLQENAEYKKMDESNQIKEMKDLLKTYERETMIKNIYYDNSQKAFSFEYNNGELKGVLGGVMLKDWNPMFN